jgi:hypothetical protein
LTREQDAKLSASPKREHARRRGHDGDEAAAPQQASERRRGGAPRGSATSRLASPREDAMRQAGESPATLPRAGAGDGAPAPAPATASSALPSDRRGANPLPTEGVAYLVEVGVTDAISAKWKLKGGDTSRAAVLLRRAQAALCRAEVRVLDLAREARARGGR